MTATTNGARERIVARIRGALATREATEHPGAFGAWRPGPAPGATEGFVALFEAAGGECVFAPDLAGAAAWLASFADDFGSVALGRGVPDPLRPRRPEVEPAGAALAVSMARGAVGETGSLLLDARDGRRTQLLAPTHVVVVSTPDVYATLGEALVALQADLPSAVGLHSGPSKSADIGQVMVRGVHGPGRVIALLIGARPGAP